MQLSAHQPVRTRFAPSPTGALHLGGMRTALYNWLLAKHFGGTFILRIEDTDLDRSTKYFAESILNSLIWLGMNPDKGPYHQTERMIIYQNALETLNQNNLTYRCYCTPERLKALREGQLAKGLSPHYDRHCAHLKPHEVQRFDREHSPYVIRFRTPQTGHISFNDHVLGALHVANQEIGDWILTRSDGMPTYNFSVVVDDIDMAITHIIRGSEHVNNTFKQLHLFNALEAPFVPEYAHVSMILGQDKQKLSKRHGAVSVLHYCEKGYLPQALLNALLRLGWSHGNQELFSRDEMIQHFSLKHLSKSPAMFNLDKLNWLNQHYLKQAPRSSIISLMQEQLARIGIKNTEHGPSLDRVIAVLSSRVKNLSTMAEQSRFLYESNINYKAEAWTHHMTPIILPALKELYHTLKALPLTSWEDSHQLMDIVRTTAQASSLQLSQLAQPLRIALTGDTLSPPIGMTLSLLGSDKTLARLQKAIHLL